MLFDLLLLLLLPSIVQLSFLRLLGTEPIAPTQHADESKQEA
jgi:hypothetical protein